MQNVFLGPIYMEESFPEQEGHPLSQVNFRERLYEEKGDPFAWFKSWQHMLWLSCLDRVDSAERAKCLYGEKLTRLRGWPLAWRRIQRRNGHCTRLCIPGLARHFFDFVVLPSWVFKPSFWVRTLLIAARPLTIKMRNTSHLVALTLSKLFNISLLQSSRQFLINWIVNHSADLRFFSFFSHFLNIRNWTKGLCADLSLCLKSVGTDCLRASK